MRGRATRFGAVGAVVAALSMSSGGESSARPAARTPEGTSIEQASCGMPGAPPCPLQKWMRANVAVPLAENNAAALAAGLQQTAALVPDPAWSSWVSMAKRGADAAKRGDIGAARASCKACHDAWRDAYRAKFRLQPVPR